MISSREGKKARGIESAGVVASTRWSSSSDRVGAAGDRAGAEMSRMTVQRYLESHGFPSGRRPSASQPTDAVPLVPA